MWTGHRKREIIDAHHANSIRLRPLSPQPPELADSRLIDPDNLLDANLNEVFLYHGTSYDVASIITQHGFDERCRAFPFAFGSLRNFDRAFAHFRRLDRGVVRSRVTNMGGLYGVDQSHLLAL